VVHPKLPGALRIGNGGNFGLPLFVYAMSDGDYIELIVEWWLVECHRVRLPIAMMLREHSANIITSRASFIGISEVVSIRLNTLMASIRHNVEYIRLGAQITPGAISMNEPIYQFDIRWFQRNDLVYSIDYALQAKQPIDDTLMNTL
jgi:hypothetical protein